LLDLPELLSSSTTTKLWNENETMICCNSLFLSSLQGLTVDGIHPLDSRFPVPHNVWRSLRLLMTGAKQLSLTFS
jgi:hypothetical protein